MLEESDIDVKIIDCAALKMDWGALKQVIRQEQPDIVGATALTPFFCHAVEVDKIAKGVNPRITTVLGGLHVTYLPEETLKENPAFDIVAQVFGIVQPQHQVTVGQLE